MTITERFTASADTEAEAENMAYAAADRWPAQYESQDIGAISVGIEVKKTHLDTWSAVVVIRAETGVPSHE